MAVFGERVNEAIKVRTNGKRPRGSTKAPSLRVDLPGTRCP